MEVSKGGEFIFLIVRKHYHNIKNFSYAYGELRRHEFNLHFFRKTNSRNGNIKV